MHCLNQIPIKGSSLNPIKFQSLPSKPLNLIKNQSFSSLNGIKMPLSVTHLGNINGFERTKVLDNGFVCNAALFLSPVDIKRPLYVTHLGNSNGFVCNAYEADHSKGLEIESESGQKMRIGLYFATWWSLNVVFNIYNKKVLNAFPFPWLTSTLSLAAGSLIMLVSWATRMVEPPNTDFEFWKSLFPVALAHTIGHVAATISMSKVAVSFTHIIKSGEPAFSVLVSRLFLGETFPIGVYLSLLPIIGGCALSAVTELNFNMIGFMGAMISNLAFVFRNIFSKRGMKGKSVSGMNYYGCLSMLSLLILTPFTIAMEGPQMWEAGWQTALTQVGPNIIWWVVAQSVFYHLYNQVSYMSLDQISPLTFSVGNTMKRISVIVSSIIIFRTPVQPVNALGAAIAILGTFIYSQDAENKDSEAEKKRLKDVELSDNSEGCVYSSTFIARQMGIRTLLTLQFHNFVMNLNIICLYPGYVSKMLSSLSMFDLFFPRTFVEVVVIFSAQFHHGLSVDHT
ncbi:glucose-6-phosphate/phosphate translocator 2 [Artemisia annua]|uniref:Glucose-6-phosphate/phosphate translocator 2 n=1 Tax=Artemisia annua TaxID=35608 RepID=A0A2U1QFI6_ARTAN|nr:glucose-6-phosphate/phosphate translocator 2 [Artemisia annua]